MMSQEHGVGEQGEDLMRAFLAEFDEQCPICGYSLRELEASCCPECGEELRFVIGLKEPKLGAWIVGLVALSVGVGMFGILLLLVSVELFNRNRMPQEFAVGVLFLFALTCPPWFLWLRGRRWFFQRNRKARVRLAVAAICWPIAMAVALLALNA